jgi:hypothetical protein
MVTDPCRLARKRQLFMVAILDCMPELMSTPNLLFSARELYRVSGRPWELLFRQDRNFWINPSGAGTSS